MGITDDYIFHRVSDLTKRDGPDVFLRLAKLVEEVGELSEALLARHNGFVEGYPKDPKSDDDVLKEAADVMITLIGVLAAALPDKSKEDLYHKVTGKLKKWEKWVVLREEVKK